MAAALTTMAAEQEPTPVAQGLYRRLTVPLGSANQVRYAVPGIEVAQDAKRCPVLRQCRCYAVSGTAIARAATLWAMHPRYAVSGTDVAYGATRTSLPPPNAKVKSAICYAMSALAVQITCERLYG
eukprot:1764601-Rhodomonas_salina.2